MPIHRPATNCNPVNGLAYVCMMKRAINSPPSSKRIQQMTQLATQLIVDFDHLPNSI